MAGSLVLLTPVGAFALIAVIAIVVIHMRQRTPPVIQLPSLRFWDPVREDSLDRRRLRRPPLTLPLMLQLLAAGLIALALVRPAIPAIPGFASQHLAPQHVIVVLDGSTSMLATTETASTVTAWDRARQEAVAILDDWQGGDVVTVIVAGSRLNTSSASTQVQRDMLRATIADAEAPGGVAAIDAALRLTASLTLPDRENHVVVITDGALHPNSLVAQMVRMPLEIRLVGADHDQPNVAVTSIGYRPLANQGRGWRLAFEMSAFATDPVRLPYRVLVDGETVASSEVDVVPGEPRSIEVTVPRESALAEVTIDIRDALTIDNAASLLLGDATSAGLAVLLISDTPGMLERALLALPDTRVDSFPAATPGIRALAVGYDLVVFEGITPAPDDIPATPMIFVRPSPIGDRFTTTGVMSRPEIDQLNASSPILDGVDLAGVAFGDTPAYRLLADEEEIVRGAANGVHGPLVWRGSLDGQRYVSFGFDLAASNITQRVAFPVLIARSVAELATPPIPGTVALGSPLLYPATDQTDRIEVTAPDRSVTTIPVVAGTALIARTGIPGVYGAREYGANNASAALNETFFVVNAGDAGESNLFANPDLGTILQGDDTTSAVSSTRDGVSELWPLFAMLALIVVVAEWFAWLGGSRWRLPPIRRRGLT